MLSYLRAPVQLSYLRIELFFETSYWKISVNMSSEKINLENEVYPPCIIESSQIEALDGSNVIQNKWELVELVTATFSSDFVSNNQFYNMLGKYFHG